MKAAPKFCIRDRRVKSLYQQQYSQLPRGSPGNSPGVGIGYVTFGTSQTGHTSSLRSPKRTSPAEASLRSFPTGTYQTAVALCSWSRTVVAAVGYGTHTRAGFESP